MASDRANGRIDLGGMLQSVFADFEGDILVRAGWGYPGPFGRWILPRRFISIPLPVHRMRRWRHTQNLDSRDGPGSAVRHRTLVRSRFLHAR